MEVTLPVAMQYGFGDLGVAPFSYEGVDAGCVVAYDPKETRAIGEYHKEIKGKDVRDINPVAIIEFHNEESIDVWIWALEEARKILHNKKTPPQTE